MANWSKKRPAEESAAPHSVPAPDTEAEAKLPPDVAALLTDIRDDLRFLRNLVERSNVLGR